MLVELRIRNFAIIDEVEIQFGPGLNILSGETGAGKSILFKCLNLLMGAKSQVDIVSRGAKEAAIEGLFKLSQRKDIIKKLQEKGFDIDAPTDSQASSATNKVTGKPTGGRSTTRTPTENSCELIVRRLIHSNGKSRVYLNGSLCTLGTLREVISPLLETSGASTPLIEITGQHDSRHLLSKAFHLEILDHYAGLIDARTEYYQKFMEWQDLRSQAKNLEEQSREIAIKLDFLSFQKKELEDFSPIVGEETELENKVKKLRNQSKLSDLTLELENQLYSNDDSIISRLHSLEHNAQEIGRFDSQFSEKLSSLAQARTLIEELTYEIRDYNGNLASSDENIDQLEARLSEFRRLQKKYASTSEEMLEALDAIKTQVFEIENHDQNLEKLKKQISDLKSELFEEGRKLHKKRLQAAKTLTDSVNHELLDLNMKGVNFRIDLNSSDSILATGLDLVEFKIRVSQKDEFRSIAKIASGGELSRILLSLKRVVGKTGYPRTYLFDEVDAGVSGETAEKVGRKLKSIARGQQLLCITHLPQVAAFADQHFLIEKIVDEKSTSTKISEVQGKKQVKEIARLISGEKITKTSLAHAKQLIEMNRAELS